MRCKKQNIASFFKKSDYHMTDISSKAATYRRAVAMGRIYVGKIAFGKIKNKSLPKGDVLKLAEIAGIIGVKNTSQIIPLCHPLFLDHIDIYLELEEETTSIAVYCLVSANAKTGVEMEALTGVNSALLTIYDLTKPVEPALTISDTRLLIKEGGKKGTWIHPDGIPEQLKKLLPMESHTLLDGINVAVITLSDRASRGEYKDKSGIILQSLIKKAGAKISNYNILPDDEEKLKNHLQKLTKSEVQLVITTGGTGVSSTDITPETILSLCNKEIPGIGELLRTTGSRHLPEAWLSRSTAGVLGNMLVISLPGNPNAVKESIGVLINILPHAVKLISGKQVPSLHECCCKHREIS